MAEEKTNGLLLGRWIDRVLLIGILALQVIVLMRLSAVFRGAPDVAGPAGAASVSEAGPRTAGGAASATGVRRPMAAIDAEGAYAATDPFVDMLGPMNAAMLHAMRDIERMSDLMRRDDGWAAMRATPAMDMRESDDAYVVVFSLPATPIDEVQVMLDGRLLSVVTPMARGDVLGRTARHRQLVQLPGPVGDVEQASASLTNGLLRVTIPKGSPPVVYRPSFRLY